MASIFAQLAKIAVPATAAAARKFVRGNTMNKVAEEGINALERLMLNAGNADDELVTTDWVGQVDALRPAINTTLALYGVEGAEDYVPSTASMRGLTKGQARSKMSEAIRDLRNAKARTASMAFTKEGIEIVSNNVVAAASVNPKLLGQLMAPKSTFPTSLDEDQIGSAETRRDAWRSNVLTTLNAMLKVPDFSDLGGKGSRTTAAVVRSYAVGEKLGDKSPPAAGCISTLTPDGVYVHPVDSAARLTTQKNLETLWDMLGVFRQGSVSASLTGSLAPTQLCGDVVVELAGPTAYTAPHPVIAQAFQGKISLAEYEIGAGQSAKRVASFGAGAMLALPDIGHVTQSRSTRLAFNGSLGVNFSVSKEVGAPPAGETVKEVVRNATPPDIAVKVLGFSVKGIKQHALRSALASTSSSVVPVLRTVRHITARHSATTPGLQYSVLPADDDINALMNQEATYYEGTAEVSLDVPADSAVFFIVQIDPRMERGDGDAGIIANETVGYPGNEIPSFNGMSGIFFTPKVTHTVQTPADTSIGLRNAMGGVRALRTAVVQGLAPEASGALAIMNIVETKTDPADSSSTIREAVWGNFKRPLAEYDSTNMQLVGEAWDSEEQSYTSPIGVGTAANYVRAISRNAQAWNKFSTEFDKIFKYGLPLTFAEFALWVPPEGRTKRDIVGEMISWCMVNDWMVQGVF